MGFYTEYYVLPLTIERVVVQELVNLSCDVKKFLGPLMDWRLLQSILTAGPVNLRHTTVTLRSHKVCVTSSIIENEESPMVL